MTKERAKLILSMLESFHKLERRNTDEIGWVAFKLSCSRPLAARRIGQAREIFKEEGLREIAVKIKAAEELAGPDEMRNITITRQQLDLLIENLQGKKPEAMTLQILQKLLKAREQADLNKVQ